MNILKHPYFLLSVLVIIVIVIDVVTGFVQAKINRNVNSPKAANGIWRKIATMVALLFGFFLELVEHYLISYASSEYDLTTKYFIPFGTIIGLYLVLSECISICENLYLAGVKLPEFITKALKIAQEKIDKNEK